jgi:hypothetical protein
MTALIDPNLAAAQSAAAAAWAAARTSGDQVIATYIAATGSFLVAVVTGVLTLQRVAEGKERTALCSNRRPANRRRNDRVDLDHSKNCTSRSSRVVR